MEEGAAPAKRSRGEASIVRARRCLELLLEGYTATEIHKLASESVRAKAESKDHDATVLWEGSEGVSVSDRQVRRYCDIARKELEAIQAMKRAQAFGSSLARRERMYRKAMDLGRVNTALRVQDSIDLLHGLTDFVPAGGGAAGPQGIKLPGGAVVHL